MKRGIEVEVALTPLIAEVPGGAVLPRMKVLNQLLIQLSLFLLRGEAFNCHVSSAEDSMR